MAKTPGQIGQVVKEMAGLGAALGVVGLVLAGGISYGALSQRVKANEDGLESVSKNQDTINTVQRVQDVNSTKIENIEGDIEEIKTEQRRSFNIIIRQLNRLEGTRTTPPVRPFP